MLLLCVAVGVVMLAPGVRVERTIAGGETHLFRIPLPPGTFVSGVVDQGEADQTIALLAPDGRRLADYDGRERGVERVSFITTDGGDYRLEIQPVSSRAPRATYHLRLDAARPAWDGDERWIEAERLATRARQHFKKGDRDSLRLAVDDRRRLLPLWQALDEPQMVLTTLVGTGDALYRLSEYGEADAVYRTALPLSRRLADPRSEAEILNNLAMSTAPSGAVAEALSLLEQSLTVWRGIPFPTGEAISLNNRGVLLRQAGDYDGARNSYTAALAIFRALGDRRSEAYAVNNLALVLDALGKPREALRRLRTAVLLLREIGETLAEGRVLVTRARIQLALGNRAASLINVRRGLGLIRTTGDRRAESEALEQLARVVDAGGDHLGARVEYERALDLYRAVGSRRGESNALHGIASTYLASGDARRALTVYEAALTLRRAVGLRSLEVETLGRMAEAERAVGNEARAQAHLEDALAIAETLRAGVFERELRTSYFSSIQHYYASYIDVLCALDLAQPNASFAARAFEVAERSKARGLVERLRESRVDRLAALEGSLLRREREVRELIDYWSFQLWQQADRPSSAAAEATIHARLERLLETHDDVEADIRRADPRLAAALSPQAVTVAAIQQEVLDPQTTLLEFVLGATRSYVWAVTREGISVAELPPRAVIERHARRFYRLVSVADGGPAGPDAVARRDREGAALARLLLAPVARVLDRQRILIVGDGMLHYVPFAAIPATDGSGPLGAGHEIVGAPSATAVLLLRRQLAGRPPAPKALAALADPVFTASDPRVKHPAAVRSADNPPARRLTRLPFSRDEVERIVALSPASQSMKATDFEASRAAATSTELSQYRFVHFATHAVQNDRYPELSGIALSLVALDGTPQDGFLRLQDVYNLDLRADLVVLSACETAIGQQVSGEGLMSLARGFFHAGAARVLATLWKVDDEATATMMPLFYQGLLGRPAMSPAAALRAAQDGMRRTRRWRDPFYWSGFVLQGDW